ncbi:NotI family restriction endonuclease [Knoellia flava]|uniref:Restriction endonuclease type II NotI domain-containing protein n=1 Tax=Knoellia flava TaxID=913969 RepID=A0A8H9KRP4_9MICO|nr:NotI family restriction endonuclease [Knoellia flava]GGB88463.1 hypothetical protein GCM10011314_30340 [Knoellia flava]
MGSTIYEWFGYAATDASPEAALAAEDKLCPHIKGMCVKRSSGGVCSIVPTGSPTPVIICPQRMYTDSHRFLKEIALEAFSDADLESGPDGLPLLTPFAQVRERALMSGRAQVGVFGQGFGGELRLPPAGNGLGRYSIDFVLTHVQSDGELATFVPVEVQSIDISNSNTRGVTALQRDRTIAPTKAGLNYENVNKRILPQLIVKGLMLQAEELCRQGIYFVSPVPVYERVLMRLGGSERLRRIPRQPGSITFWPIDYGAAIVPGQTIPIRRTVGRTISTSDMSIAFITPENLPPAGAYEDRIRHHL